MHAAVYRGPGQIVIEEIPRPEIGPGELLVRVDVCGVCPTDIKKIAKGLLPPPRVFGHEMAGRVVEVGKGAQGYTLGERVVVHHHVPCGSCFYCAREAYAQCETYKRNGTTAGFEPAGGGFAEYIRVMDWIVRRGVVRIPDSVTSEEASFVEPVNTCLKAVETATVRSGETALVVGQGPVGLVLMQILRSRGVQVLVSDMLADRLELAQSLGADRVLQAGGEIEREVHEKTEGRGVDCAFLAAPGEPAFNQALACTRPAGRVLVFSATSRGETAVVDLGPLCTSEKSILTSYSSSIDLQAEAARLVFSRTVKVRDLITHRFPLAETALALATASRPAPGSLKSVVQMQGEGTRTV
jgi:L-iditol 2-dehydrogenase